jgi:hypothetical protein
VCEFYYVLEEDDPIVISCFGKGIPPFKGDNLGQVGPVELRHLLLSVISEIHQISPGHYTYTTDDYSPMVFVDTNDHKYSSSTVIDSNYPIFNAAS